MKKHTTHTKEATHDRIVEAAARAIRRTGYNGTGVADIMKDAGLTHGGFYAHFASRDAMLAEAADRAGAQAVISASKVASSAPHGQSLEYMVRAYLSPQHQEDIESGCPIAALGSEMPRQAPEVRHAATCRIKEMIEVIAGQIPDPDLINKNRRALMTISNIVGALILARAVDDPQLAESISHAVIEQLTAGGS
ncbi:TetR/AcrR family transcriptional regulator [Yersinia enterocolitica]|uniref:TetR/AcrR family transcriptional regulator n=1 Tax=Yersinia enterocolitica TaxID=630 RepID=UPI001C8E194D|nr:TetR/AcrR family transcriptional regulator [Yersinia enterocolitica]MBX9478796.1 TetR/AcrR family transcriptional regulator [Yersinia enterocolitica]